jgi:hypothetical protein
MNIKEMFNGATIKLDGYGTIVDILDNNNLLIKINKDILDVDVVSGKTAQETIINDSKIVDADDIYDFDGIVNKLRELLKPTDEFKSSFPTLKYYSIHNKHFTNDLYINLNLNFKIDVVYFKSNKQLIINIVNILNKGEINYSCNSYRPLLNKLHSLLWNDCRYKIQ